MNTEQAKQLADNALNLLIEALEKGQSETLKLYLATMGRFHNYSFGNCMMIAAQKPDATHVAGFHSWLKFQRHVRKGEKGIVILAPMVGKKTESAEMADDEQSRVFGFRAAYVFDVSQTEGEPLPEFPRDWRGHRRYRFRPRHAPPRSLQPQVRRPPLYPLRATFHRNQHAGPFPAVRQR